MGQSQLQRVAEILKEAGWRDNCDAQWSGLEKALPELAAALAPAEMVDALRWYERMAKEMGKAAIHQNSKRMLDLMKEIAVDYGKKASAALAPVADKLAEALGVLLALHDNKVHVAEPWEITMEEARAALAEYDRQRGGE